MIKKYLEDVYTIEGSNNNEFAQNYMYEFYEELIEDMPWELSYSIEYDTVFNKLQMTMSITKDPAVTPELLISYRTGRIAVVI